MRILPRRRQSPPKKGPGKQRRFSGLFLAALGLCIGLGGGLTITAIERTVEKVLVDLLRGEAAAACPCEFAVESINFSLLRLSGEAVNARITKDGVDQMVVPKLTARFDLFSKILEKRIAITSLKLFNPILAGVGPKSGAFQFISELAKPLPEEKKKEWKIRVKLMNLEVIDGSAFETLPSGKITADGFQLSFHRDELDNLNLTPRIRRVGYESASQRRWRIGKIESSLYITDETVTLEEIALSLGESFLKLKGMVQKFPSESVDLTALGHLRTSDIKQSYLKDGNLTAHGQFRGTPSVLEGALELETDPDAPLLLEFDEISLPPLSFSSALKATPQQNDTTWALDDLVAKFPTEGTLMSSTGIEYRNGKLVGEIEVEFEELTLDSMSLKRGGFFIQLQEDEGHQFIKLVGDVQETELSSLALPSLQIEALLQESELTFQIAQSARGPIPSSQNAPATMLLAGGINLGEPNPRLDELEVRIHELPLLDLTHTSSFTEASRGDSPTSRVLLSAEGSFSGPLSPEELTGKLALRITNTALSSPTLLDGELLLEKGAMFSGTFQNASRSLRLELQSDSAHPQEILTKLSVSSFPMNEALPELSCIEVGLETEYRFALDEPLNGEGTTLINQLDVGCAPYTISLTKPYTARMGNRALSVEQLEFSSENSHVEIQGKVGPDIFQGNIEGNILLRSLLPIAPSLDDLSGQLEVHASVSGTMSSPIFLGTAVLHNGTFSSEASDIVGKNLSGTLQMSKEGFSLQNLHGELNGGETHLEGFIPTDGGKPLTVSLSFQDVLYQPDETTYAIASGDISLNKTKGDIPKVQGSLVIENAEILRDFDLRTLLRSLSSNAFSDNSTNSIQKQQLPDIELDLTVSASGDLFLITSFFGVEAEGLLRISGKAQDPHIQGNITTKRGWLGFNETRFEIISGEVVFQTPEKVPELNVVGETNARGSRGENTLIIFEASGPLDSPRISLSSDQGLTEREILALLETRSDFRITSSSFDRRGVLDLPSANTLPYEQGFIRRFLNTVTRIDHVNFQPKFNARRGQLEPALVAEKNLLPKLDLIAESFLSSPEEGSQLFLKYQLAPRLQAIGTLDTVTVQTASSVGVDLAYTVLAKETRFSTFAVTGANYFSGDEILENNRLSSSSQIRSKDLPKLKKDITQQYQDRGFFFAQVDTSCEEIDEYCRLITINIDEGPRSIITAARYQGDPLPPAWKQRIEDLITRRAPATQRRLLNIEQDLIRELRSEGYLQARVDLRYEPVGNHEKGKNQRETLLVVTFHQGEALSIIFEGNTHFSNRELLDTINLFGRKQPFGNNTLSILTRNIERAYREAGFLYVTIKTSERYDEQASRKVFRIVIQEEEKVEVEDVTLRGLKRIRLEDIENQFREDGEKHILSSIFSPQYVVSEEIENNERLLERALSFLGFPKASVTSEVIPDPLESSANIEYVITENDRVHASTIRFENLPEDVLQPELPPLPYSIPKANRIISKLKLALQDAGYFYGEVTTTIENGVLTVSVNPGQKEEIEKVSLFGNVYVPASLIHDTLRIEDNKYWSAERSKKARTSLLSKGLFSRVQIDRVPVAVGKSHLEVRVVERPLQTLELGAGINSVFGAHFFGEAIERELFLDGRNLSLRFDTFYDDTTGEVSRGLAGLRYSNPTFSEYDINHTQDLRFERLELATQEFDLNRVSLASALTKTFERTSFSFSHTIFQEDLDDVTPDAVLDPDLDTGQVRLSFLSLTASYDGRDNPLVPESGFNLGSEMRFASQAIGSEANYVSALGRASYLVPFDVKYSHFGFASGMRAGVSTPLQDTEDIPISQRFYLGGRTTVRGFRENSLGPRGSEGAVIGGDIFVSLNNELRYFPSDALSLHTFLDGGTVYLEEVGIDGDELRWSTGVGFRYLSPIGPIGFDLGFPLEERPGEPSLRLHFAIGSSF